MTINSRLQKLALEDPEKPAFIFWDKDLNRTVLTRQDVWDKSRKCAAFLRRQGVVKGDVVGNTLVNSQERLISMYGTVLAGAVTMHCQKFLADGQDVLKNMEDAQCKTIIVDIKEENGVDMILEKIKIIDKKTGKIQYEGLSKLDKVIPVARASWLQTLDDEQEMYVDNTITEDEVAMVMVTSGSTGFSKLVPHNHKGLSTTACHIKQAVHLYENCVYLNEDALGWVGGAPIMYPYIGLTRILVDWGEGPVKTDYGAMILNVLEHETCDAAHFTPIEIGTILYQMDSMKKQKLTKLIRVLATSGGPVSTSIMEAIGRISDSISVMYGATEIDIIYSLNVTDPSDFENACCGYAIMSGEAKIVNRELQEVGPCETGEILVRGSNMFQGYLNNPEANRKSLLADGWWRTSDIGHINEKGQLFVYCRKSNVINCKGYKHFPGWMESMIDKHPYINKSYVIGLPHPIEHHEICLCVLLSKNPESTLTTEEAREYCKSLFLTSDADEITPVPKYVLFFDSFPHKNNGKVDRTALKELARTRVEVGAKNN